MDKKTPDSLRFAAMLGGNLKYLRLRRKIFMPLLLVVSKRLQQVMTTLLTAMTTSKTPKPLMFL